MGFELWTDAIGMQRYNRYARRSYCIKCTKSTNKPYGPEYNFIFRRRLEGNVASTIKVCD